jgi:hypothetical protein
MATPVAAASQCRSCHRRGRYVVRTTDFEDYSLACGHHLAVVVEAVIQRNPGIHIFVDNRYAQSAQPSDRSAVDLHRDLAGIYVKHGEHHFAAMHLQIVSMIEKARKAP